MRGVSWVHRVALGLWLVTGAASARTEAEIGYTRTQTFSAALRYLRVDLAYEVTEKDAEAAYLLFTFAAPELQKKTAHGSIEVIERERGVRLVVSLPELPSYQEEVLKRGLLQKLRTEYGEPPERAAPPPPKRDKGERERESDPEPKEPSEDKPPEGKERGSR